MADVIVRRAFCFPEKTVAAVFSRGSIHAQNYVMRHEKEKIMVAVRDSPGSQRVLSAACTLTDARALFTWGRACRARAEPRKLDTQTYMYEPMLKCHESLMPTFSRAKHVSSNWILISINTATTSTQLKTHLHCDSQRPMNSIKLLGVHPDGSRLDREISRLSKLREIFLISASPGSKGLLPEERWHQGKNKIYNYTTAVHNYIQLYIVYVNSGTIYGAYSKNL